MAESIHTLMSIDGIDFSPYATRGITMSIKPIDAGETARDVNGELVDLTLAAFRKYEVAVECTDHEAPTLNDVWRGKLVTVTCIPQLGPDNNSDETITLTMMVEDWTSSREEWAASTAWTLTLKQV